MGLMDELSTSLELRNSEPNKAVAEKIIEDAALLHEIVVGMDTARDGLLADCAEVFTMVSEVKPELVAPHCDKLPPLLTHKKARVRWEAAHSLAYCAHLIPDLITDLLPTIEALITTDKSTIVRDYLITAVGNYGGNSAAAANLAFPLLKTAETVYDGKHAKLVLNGYAKLAQYLPEENPFFEATLTAYKKHIRASVKKAARDLEKVIL